MELRRRTNKAVPYNVMAQTKVRRPIAVMFDLMAEYMEMTRPEAFREAIFHLLAQEGEGRPELDVHPMHRRVRKSPAVADNAPQDTDTILMQTFLTYDQWDRLLKTETHIGVNTPMVMRDAIYRYMFANGYKFKRPSGDLPTIYGEDDQ